MGRIESDLINGQVYHREAPPPSHSHPQTFQNHFRSSAAQALSNEEDCRSLSQSQLLSHDAHLLNKLSLVDMPLPPLAERAAPEKLQFGIAAPGSPPLHSPRGDSAARLPANVSLNDKHQIEKIAYPAENKTREFGRDDKGEINTLTTTTPEGKYNYVKEGGNWFLLGADNKKYPAPPIALNNNGEFSRRSKDSTWTTQLPDGTSFTEQVNAAGARLKVSDEGKVERIVRGDGSEISAKYESTENGTLSAVTERRGESSVVWRKNPSGEWRSNEDEPRTVRDLNLGKDGNTTFTTTDGVKHIIRGNGIELEEGSGRGKFEFDEQGRFKSIHTADGRERSFEYKGNSNDVIAVNINDRAKGENSRFIRQGEGNWAHLNESGQIDATWKGSIKVTADGTYCVKPEDSKVDAWRSYGPDGSTHLERRSPDGSVARLDDSGKVLSVSRKDGGSATFEYDSKGLAKLTQTSPDGSNINWSRQDDGRFKSDSPQFPVPVAQFTATESGAATFSDADGARATAAVDGSVHIVRADGAYVDRNKEGQVVRTGIDSKNYQTFAYENGELSKFAQTTPGGTVEWTRQPNGQEQRQDISVSAQGFMSYKLDGKTYVEAPNMAQLELNKDCKVEKATLPNGASREFGYSATGELQSIIDTRVTDKGPVTKTLTRIEDGAAGKNRFETVSGTGKKSILSDLTVDNAGNYEAETSDGKHKIARAQDLLKPSDKSESVDEARETLESLAEAKGIKMDRLRSFMDKFEKRCEASRTAGMQAPSEEQIAKTYDNLSAMLRGKEGGSSMDDKKRARLCEEGLYNMATPTRINQGSNPTCNMTTGEIYIASRQPDKYADVLKQVALNGKLKTTTGKEVTVHPSGLTPTQEEGAFDPEADYKYNCRNWASHVMQIYGINSFTQFQAPNANPVLSAWGHQYLGGDNNPGMGGDAIKQAVRELSGADMPYFDHLVAPTEEQLWRYKEEGNFPVGIPTLYANIPQLGLSEQHVQTIQDVREVDGRTQVFLDDQNGLPNDAGWVSLEQLYAQQRLRGPAQTGQHGPKFKRGR